MPEATADPEEFRAMNRETDVDGDGLIDRVRELPSLRVADAGVSVLAGVPPVVVAHRLADGRFARDDEVTRAALRGPCPEPRWQPPPGDPPGDAASALAALFWSGFCARAWGASPADAVRTVREFAATPAAGAITREGVDAAVEAVQAAVLPITLRALPAPTLRGWRPTPTQAIPRPAEPVTPAPAVDARCAVVMAANRRRVAAANRRAEASVAARGSEGASPLDFAGSSHCAGTAAGVWRLTYETATFAAGEEPCLRASVALAWVPVAGRPQVRPNAFTAESCTITSAQPSIFGVFDWDGDGSPEVAVQTMATERERAPELPITLFTAGPAGVVPYGPARDFEHVVAVTDVDADGRPDLILASPWTRVDDCGLAGIEHPGPSLVAHAQADGSFSLRDDTARAWVARQCARAEHDRAMLRADVIDLACARALGQSPDEVVAAAWALTAALRRQDPERAGDEARCMPFARLASSALRAAPFPALPSPREASAPVDAR